MCYTAAGWKGEDSDTPAHFFLLQPFGQSALNNFLLAHASRQSNQFCWWMWPSCPVGLWNSYSLPCFSLSDSLISSHLSPNHEGRWGTTDDFATSFLHFSLFSTALWDLANSRPVHSLMLSSHLILYLLVFFPPFTVPCKMVLARPDERETWPYHCSLRLFTMVKSSCGPIACWILARTSSLVTWSLYEMCSILQ